jgi:hypothetical protein
MLVLRHRLAIAGVVTATAIAVPAAALASGPGSPPSAKPAPPQASAASASKSAQVPSPLPALAASAGISVSQLQTGLMAAKQAGGNTAAGIAAFAASTGVSHATAQRVVYAVFGTQVIKRPSLTGQPPAPVSALAAQLGVSHSAAQRAFSQLDALGRDGIDPASPAFAAIAHELGVSPTRLAAALAAVKQGMAGR